MKEHLRVLDLASREALPSQIDEASDPSVGVVRELVEAGYLWAIDASTFDGPAYLNPRITLPGREYLAELTTQLQEADRELLAKIDRLRATLVSVSTGGPKIDEVNHSYKQLYFEVDSELHKRGIPNPIQFSDLWDWYGRWSSGDLPSYQSRREFVAALFKPLIDRVRSGASDAEQTAISVEPTGWLRVDRTIGEIRKRLSEAYSEEQFQAVGLLCREAIISLAQAVYDRTKHPPLDETEPSETDAKRMLESYISIELSGSSHEASRRHAKAAYALAVDLQHRRTATFRQAALCAEATASLVNVIAIVSGHRDPP